ncbi:MAG: aminotransferase class I/II-fold pyridoxal phosphate-dependent enzyme [Chloroflexota bacterium]
MPSSEVLARLAGLRGMALTYALIAEGKRFDKVIALSRGDPDFATPAHIVEAARGAMRAPSLAPPPVEGLPELRRAIAERVARVNGIHVDPNDGVVVTNGGQEALFLMVVAALGEGDGMLVPDPSYATYYDALRFARAERVPVPTFARESFRIDPERVDALVDRHPNVRALLLISPGNPTGAVSSPSDVRALASIAAERGLTILADDIYDRFVYDGAAHLSPASLPDASGRTLTLNACSKTYAMTGWRIGWIVGPEPLMARIREIKAALSGGTSVVCQQAALAALTGPQEAVDEMRTTMARRRSIVTAAFARVGLLQSEPMGGQFIFADAGSLGISSLELALRVLEEEQVLIAPGLSFGEEWGTHIRVTFLQPEDVLAEAMERLERVVSRVRAAQEAPRS